MNRSLVGFAAALVAVSCMFLGLARADEKAAAKAECGYCKAVKTVTEHMRCGACAKADKACEKCAAMAKKVADTAACKPCKDGKGEGCGECGAMIAKDAHCAFCAGKKAVADHAYCCNGCASAKKTECAKCKEVRDAVMAVKCEECAKAGKH